MPKSKSSRRWLAEHFADPYVKSAQKEGYRSRAAYKLLEIQKRDKLFQPGMVVVDLGAAPGSWSQVAKRLVGKNGKVFALDILPMLPLDGVSFVEGDFRDEAVIESLLTLLNNQPVDIVISDMAPNLSGITGVDRPRAVYLAELALDLVKQVLRPSGTFLLKLFQGEGFDEFLRELRVYFKSVVVRKPSASKARSAEVYLLAKGFKKVD